MSAMMNHMFEPKRLPIRTQLDRQILEQRILTYMTVNHHSLITRNKTHEIALDHEDVDAVRVRYEAGEYQLTLTKSDGRALIEAKHETPHGAVLTLRRELEERVPTSGGRVFGP